MAVVTPIASFARSGLADFVLQRATAVVLGLYALCVLGFFVVSAPMDQAGLAAFFGTLPMQAFTTLALMALAAHAWIGMWTVGTDYIRQHYFGRGHVLYLAIYQLGCVGLIFVYLIWPLSVIWGLR